jgi:hypothetical protein
MAAATGCGWRSVAGHRRQRVVVEAGEVALEIWGCWGKGASWSVTEKWRVVGGGGRWVTTDGRRRPTELMVFWLGLGVKYLGLLGGRGSMAGSLLEEMTIGGFRIDCNRTTLFLNKNYC